jgi:hypothetical protein
VEDQYIDLQLVKKGDYVFITSESVEGYSFPLSLGKVSEVGPASGDKARQLKLHWQYPESLAYEGRWKPWNMRDADADKAKKGKKAVVAYSDWMEVNTTVRPIRVAIGTPERSKYHLSRSTLKQLLADAQGEKLSHWKPITCSTLDINLYIHIYIYIKCIYSNSINVLSAWLFGFHINQ